MSEWKRKIARRGSVRSAVTKHLTEVNNTLSVITQANKMEANVMLDKLTRRLEELTEMDNAILDNVKDEEFADEVNKVDEYRDQLTTAIKILDVKIKELDKPVTRQQDPVMQAQMMDRQLSSPGPSVLRERVPEMKLTKFDGNPLNWETFWDDFRTSVDAREDIPAITKFKLLRSCLTGHAEATCKGYKLTESNYEHVKSVLEERYGDQETAVALHLEAIVQLKPASSHSVSELIRVRDECEANIRALGILGFQEETFGQLFAPIVLSKLPKFVRLDIRKQRKMSGERTWTMEKLRETLSSEIELRAMNEREFFHTEQETDKIPRKKREMDRRTGGTASTLHVNTASGKKKGFQRGQSPKKESSQYSAGSCAFCDGHHHSDKCQMFKDVEKRQARLYERFLCFMCLKPGHRAFSCPVLRQPCYYCQKYDHHRSLCLKMFGKTTEPSITVKGEKQARSALNVTAPAFEPTKSDNYAVHTVPAKNPSRRRCGTAILESALVRVVGESGSCMARIVLDNGSTKSYVSGKLVRKIGAKRVGFEVTAVGRFGETKRQTRQLAMHEFSIALRDGSAKLVEMDVEEHLAPPLTIHPVDLDQFAQYCQPSELAEVIVDEPTEVEIDILMGLDYYYSFINGKTFHCANGLVLKESAVGYIVTGFNKDVLDSSGKESVSLQMIVIGDRRRDPFDLEKFWRLEEIGIKDKPGLNDDEAALQHFNDTVKVVENRYEVQFPFKTEQPDLPDNYSLALKRLQSVLRKIRGDAKLLESYDSTFRTQESLGVIERAPDVPDGLVHYLCHHAVLTPQKTTTKVRVVFDASAKSDRGKMSLNEAMFRGPVILENLCGMLIRFRLREVAIVSDVEKAFLQISLQVQHRDCTRFLWLRDPSKPASGDNLVVYRYTRVLFGATASPFLLAASINHHLKRVGGETAEDIVRNTYVDNVVSGQPTSSAALRYYGEAKDLFGMISMNLREWYSNDQQFLAGVAEPDRGKDPVPSVLGLKWFVSEDRISCTVGKLHEGAQMTKRLILRSIASTYDPCGYFGPITIRGKMLMQSLWVSAKGWDEPASESIASTWKDLVKDLQDLEQMKMSRFIGVDSDAEAIDIQLHCFCDASAKAYGAAVYLRLDSNLGIKSNLIFAKSRVAPLRKELSIPRLELVAVTIGSQLLEFVANELLLEVSKKIVWTDSLCVLSWLQSSSISTVFVSNRVKQIKSNLSLQFRHVPTAENPADLLSRGTPLNSLKENDLWWKGPTWLSEPEQCWPLKEIPVKLQAIDFQEKLEKHRSDEQTLLLVTAKTPLADSLFDVSRYSSRRKLLGVTCRVVRALNAMVPKFMVSRYPQLVIRSWKRYLVKREIVEATRFWDRRIQQQYFPEAFSKNPSRGWRNFEDQLRLFVDSQGLLRCEGRFEHAKELARSAKDPILLPKGGYYTRLVITECHVRVLHMGLSQTLGEVRRNYWVPQGRPLIKQVVNRCWYCNRRKPKTYLVPNPPPLPEFRSSVHRPFECVGLDYLGPLKIKVTLGVQKVWIALYTCAVIRAIHLEVIGSLSAMDFLLCLRRFMGLYGQPSLVVSDNAKQFKVADGVLRKLWKEVLQSEEVQSFSATNGVEWKFIPEFSPWMGGFYERLVLPVKDALRKSLGSRTVSLEELQTLVIEIAAVVNSRPLLYAGSEPGEPVLTPSHLMFRSQDVFPEVGDVDEFQLRNTKADDLIQHWKKGQKILRQFWDTWRSQYLLGLREKQVKHRQRDVSYVEPTVGSTVLLKESCPRGMWRMGRIMNLIASNDGQIRSAEVRLANKRLIRRPLKLLCPLEMVSEFPRNVSKDSANDQVSVQSNPETPSDNTVPDADRVVRPKRKAAIKAGELVRQQLQQDDSCEE